MQVAHRNADEIVALSRPDSFRGASAQHESYLPKAVRSERVQDQQVEGSVVDSEVVGRKLRFTSRVLADGSTLYTPAESVATTTHGNAYEDYGPMRNTSFLRKHDAKLKTRGAAKVPQGSSKGPLRHRMSIVRTPVFFSRKFRTLYGLNVIVFYQESVVLII